MAGKDGVYSPKKSIEVIPLQEGITESAEALKQLAAATMLMSDHLDRLMKKSAGPNGPDSMVWALQYRERLLAQIQSLAYQIVSESTPKDKKVRRIVLMSNTRMSDLFLAGGSGKGNPATSRPEPPGVSVAGKRTKPEKSGKLHELSVRRFMSS